MISRTTTVLYFSFLAVGLWLASPQATQADVPSPSASANFHVRGNLDNARLQFEGKKLGRVAFMGGSITEMNGYRPMVCEILRRRFPQTKFTFVDAGISSTCSTSGAFRLADHVLSKGPIDLFFVEFAVNDDQDAGHARRECIRGLEGIIRHARQSNPNMDIVVTHFVNPGMLKTLQAGKTPLTIGSHETVAKHYDVSTVNLAQEVAQQITAEKLTWKKFGGTHPGPHGNGICANMIDQLLTVAWKKPLDKSSSLLAHSIPKPLDPLNYGDGRFVDLTMAKIKSGWKLGVPQWKQLKGGKRSRFTSIDMLSAEKPGAELTLEFSGAAVGAYIVAGPDAGVAEASVDGGPFRQVNLFHRYSRGLHYPRTVMLATDLKPGKHTLTLRIAEKTQNGGHAMRIMQFVAN